MSTRCSVFMKSDCTHKLNKGEATKDDIVLSLSDVMATKVVDFLKRAKITNGRVLLTGGVTRNRHIVRFVREKLPGHRVHRPGRGALLRGLRRRPPGARHREPAFPGADKLFKPQEIDFARYQSLKTAEGQGQLPARRSGARRSRAASTSSASTAARPPPRSRLIDTETDEIVASHYGRTHGDPVKALKDCLVEVKKQLQEQIGDAKINITLAATTGSSREILGVFLETPGVYNEIIAHTVGTTYFEPDVDTIFEIGGQDAKYVLLKNGVPIDYAMNEACSAGHRLLPRGIGRRRPQHRQRREIGDIALQARRARSSSASTARPSSTPTSARPIQQGASREDITAGIVFSIVANYLNRVVGNRTIGSKIVLQGGVAKNKAVPAGLRHAPGQGHHWSRPTRSSWAASASGILAKQKYAGRAPREGRASTSTRSWTRRSSTSASSPARPATTSAPSRCSNVNGHKYMFGGRCNKYTNMRKKKKIDDRRSSTTSRSASSSCSTNARRRPEDFVKKRDFTVGIPARSPCTPSGPSTPGSSTRSASRPSSPTEVAHDGVARAESTYCFPAEIAHGAVQDVLDKGAGLHLPAALPRHAELRGRRARQLLPHHAGPALLHQEGLPRDRREEVPRAGRQLQVRRRRRPWSTSSRWASGSGIAEREVRQRLRRRPAPSRTSTSSRHREMGKEALEEARKADQPVIAVLGRPYNAFTRDANMGIPRKFTTRGYSVIPFDMPALRGGETSSPTCTGTTASRT